MATTTNYGWTTPDDTALVKDGAAAIRTLGSSVDTTTKNLNPETTLADLAYRSSTANVKTRLAIGSTGQVLTVAGGVPTWATPAPASSGLTHISTTSFSNVATQDFSAVFTSTYLTYLVVINNLFAGTAADDLYLRMRYGSSVLDSGGSYYGTYRNDYNSANSVYDTQNQFTLSINSGLETYGGTGGWFYVTNVARSATANATIQGMFNFYAGATSIFGGSTVNLQNYNGFRLLTSSSNITGSVSIYGLANS